MPTRYPLSIHLVIDDFGKKNAEFNLHKRSNRYSEDYIQTTCISSDHDQKTSEFSKESV